MSLPLTSSSSPISTAASLSSAAPLASVQSILAIMAANIPSRVLLPPIFSSYVSCVNAGEGPVTHLFFLLGHVCAHMDRETVASSYIKLFKFFLTSFDYRQHLDAHQKSPAAAASSAPVRPEKVEAAVIEAFLKLIMKLNEAQMKPLFLKVLEWATSTSVANIAAAAHGGDEEDKDMQEDSEESEEEDSEDDSDSDSDGESKKKKKKSKGKKKKKKSSSSPFSASDALTTEDLHRRHLLFGLVDSLADKLRSIFVPYFAYLIDLSVSHLERARLLVLAEGDEDAAEDESFAAGRKGDIDGDDFFVSAPSASSSSHVAGGSKKRKRTRGVQLFSHPVVAIARYALSSLHKCFLYDTDKFIDRERFQKVLSPLVDQLDMSGLGAMFKPYTETLVIPCITQLAMTVADDTLWKPLNYQVLMKGRSESPRIRAASLRVAQEMLVKLGEPYLTLLPDTLPFLSELMEDDDVEVERLSQSFVKQIEELSGSSIQEHFQ
eukprot:GILI01007405.1.p1 GENE.GILI01007405.1~~GILI01007405.1.p1  ORF type:complete len:500 (+),score=181.80 GILI01007405.1:25-1500(+)